MFDLNFSVKQNRLQKTMIYSSGEGKISYTHSGMLMLACINLKELVVNFSEIFQASY